jgi:signal transduction histidine kinase
MFYTVIILLCFSLFIMLKNPNRGYDWLLSLLIVLTAVRIAAIILFVAKYGYYQRADNPLFLFDYNVSLLVFNFRYGPYDIGSLGYMLEAVFLIILTAFYAVYQQIRLSVTEICICAAVVLAHLLLHLPGVRYALYIRFVQTEAFGLIALYYGSYQLVEVLYLGYICCLCLRLYRSARQSTIISRSYEKLSYLAIVGTSSTLFLLFCIVDPVRLHMMRDRSANALIDISLQYELPLFYITILPWIVLLIMSVNVFMLLKYSRVAFKEAVVIYLQERKMQTINQAVRFLFHSLKNDLFSLTLITKDIRQAGSADLTPLLTEHDELAGHALRTIARFLDQTRSIALRPTVCSISTILSPIIDQLAVCYPAVSCTLQIPHDAHWLVDRELFTEAIRNCCINAAEAAVANPKARPQVTVRTTMEQQWVAVTVIDTGKGLSRAERRVLFRPLKSGSVSMTNWGIGLNYSYRVMRAHRGYIQIDPHASEGAVFELSAPVAIQRGGTVHAAAQ